MSYKIYDVACDNYDCDKYNTRVEVFDEPDAEFHCDACNTLMVKCITYPARVQVSKFDSFKYGRKNRLRNVFKPVKDED